MFHDRDRKMSTENDLDYSGLDLIGEHLQNISTFVWQEKVNTPGSNHYGCGSAVRFTRNESIVSVGNSQWYASYL